MIETALTILEAAGVTYDVCRRVSTLVFGNKQEQLLAELVAKMNNMELQIERLSDSILYAVNLDGVRGSGGKQRYIDNLREAKEILMPLQKSFNQSILASAMIQAPPQLEKLSSQELERRFIARPDPIDNAVSMSLDRYVPVLFEKEGQYYIGWQEKTKLSEQIGCEYQPHWQLNQQQLSSQKKVDIAAFQRLGEIKSSRTKPSQLKISDKDQKFSLEVVTVDKTGKINKRESKQAYYRIEKIKEGVNLEMVSIPGGCFEMGSPKTEEGRYNNEGPQYKVTISPFYMGKYPVTQAQWQAVMGNNPSRFKEEKRPVEKVSWEDAVKFCEKLSKLMGKNYRLPSEAEWEYVCRAGTTTPFYFGETITTELANYDGNKTYGSGPKGEYRKETTDVGIFSPNGFGLYDMHGNVWEWCADLWHGNYEGAPTDGSAWERGGKDYRVLRGGSWVYDPTVVRTAYRSRGTSVSRDNGGGFRVAFARDL